MTGKSLNSEIKNSSVRNEYNQTALTNSNDNIYYCPPTDYHANQEFPDNNYVTNRENSFSTLEPNENFSKIRSYMLAEVENEFSQLGVNISIPDNCDVTTIIMCKDITKQLANKDRAFKCTKPCVIL